MLTALSRLISMLLAACAVGGCSDLREEPRGDLFIRGALWPSRADDCQTRPDPTARLVLTAVMDQAFVRMYSAALLVGNKIPDDARGVSLHSANVRLENETTHVVVGQFTTPATGFVDPPSGGAAGFGVTLVPLIVAEAVTPPALVTARIRVVGKIAGGADVESSELTLPITVCDGCLVSFPSDAIDFATGSCVGGPPDPPPCIMGQDETFDCRLCAGNNAACHSSGAIE